MPTLLIRRRRPIGEPDRPVGTEGAGRLVQALLDLGVEMGDLRQLVVVPDGPIADTGAIDLGAAFDLVVLGSHLVNNPDAERRAAFVSVAARHLAPGGRLLVEHHPLDWAETAEPTRPTPGAALGMVDVRRHPPFVSAVSVYDAGGRIVRQPFTARVLSERDLDDVLADAGLVRGHRVSPTWLDARRVAGQAGSASP